MTVRGIVNALQCSYDDDLTRAAATAGDAQAASRSLDSSTATATRWLVAADANSVAAATAAARVETSAQSALKRTRIASSLISCK